MSAGLLLHTPLPPKKYLFYRYDMSKMGFNLRLLCNHLYDSPNVFESFFLLSEEMIFWVKVYKEVCYSIAGATSHEDV